MKQKTLMGKLRNFKDEANDIIITEFIWIRFSLYSYSVDDDGGTKTFK